jgi:putative DNA methylase
MEQTSGPGVLWTDGSRFMPAPAAPGMPRAIDEAFPFEQISEIAEAESWRKEVFRPIYHLHKWWAQRLGSVFRAALLAAALPAEERESVLEWYGRRVSWPDLVVFDPFMGSGTIVGEAYKLGCKVIGRDINPVAYRAVCTALGPLERRDLLEQYQRLEATAGKRIRQLYQSQDSRGYPCEVLYYFWVKTLNCLHCGRSVELFPHYVFARHADRTREVRVQVLCPECGEVFPMERDQAETQCPACRRRFNPHQGPAKRTTAVCTSCGREFSLVAAARAQGKPPGHHLYAKLVLRTDGSKEYLRSTPEDMLLYEQASRWLREWKPPLPQVEIRTGNNTRQILNYGYRYWHQLFNERQLLALAILAEAICDLPAGPARDALALTPGVCVLTATRAWM